MRQNTLKEYTEADLPLLLHVEQADLHPKTANAIEGYHPNARTNTAQDRMHPFSLEPNKKVRTANERKRNHTVNFFQTT
jgi:hypothetical protein